MIGHATGWACVSITIQWMHEQCVPGRPGYKASATVMQPNTVDQCLLSLVALMVAGPYCVFCTRPLPEYKASACSTADQCLLSLAALMVAGPLVSCD